MCGIAGLLAPPKYFTSDIQDVVRNMASQMFHRGPDDGRQWLDPVSGIALAHRRLAILDLSDAGGQPMTSHCGRYVLVFNGEIYNHEAIRRELESEGCPLTSVGWRGHSDTETLLTAIFFWGLERTLHKSVGMFAFVLWDKKNRELYFARDRVGEKPLYYGLHKGVLLFSSELKALRTYPGFHGEVDRNALSLLLRRNVIPAPHTIYRGIFKLPPGSWLKLNLADVVKGRLPIPQSYWTAAKVAAAGQDNLFHGDFLDASDELERLLKQSISGQMLADVPLGAFLSGGVDSSTVTALMQAQSAKPVKTFTIGFHESDYNEAEYARSVASYLGTEHTSIFVTPKQALDVIPKLPILYDEPFADASQIPTFLVSELARRKVTVCLSGDGGDELFGGYNRYIIGGKLGRKLGWVPHILRARIAAIIKSTPPALWNARFDRFRSILPKNWGVRMPGDKLHKLAEVLSVTSPNEIYNQLVSQWPNSDNVVIGSKEHAYLNLSDHNCASLLPDLEHQMMCLDMTTYLPDDVLVKVDRAAMGVSLETRAPMLDHRIVEFAWTLPLQMKIQGSKGKLILREVLDRYVPRALIDRPKTGFGVPIDSWLRGPLKHWAEELLESSHLKNQGFFEAKLIRMKWEEHLSGKRNWSNQLWSVLMFQAWLSENHGIN